MPGRTDGDQDPAVRTGTAMAANPVHVPVMLERTLELLDPALAGHATVPIFIPNGAGPSVSPQVSLFAILHWWPWWYYVDLLLQF